MRNALTYWLRHWAEALWLVAILGTGTGVATSVIAVANAALWRRLPVKRPQELVRILADNRNPEGTIFPTEYELWHQRQDALAGIASYQFDVPLDLDLGGRVERLNGVHVTTNMFDVLGAAPIAGRTFVSSDARRGAAPVAILSERVWRTMFNANRAIIGGTIRIGRVGETRAVTVIGIAPASLDIQSFFLGGVDIYRPVSDGVPDPSFGALRTSSRYVIGRLRSTADARLAQARVSALARAVADEVPTRERTKGARFESLHDSLFGGGTRFIVLMGVAALFVVIVACGNGVSVVLALGSRRSRERAIRLALGATRGALVAQAIREAVVIAGGAAVVALLVSRWLIDTIVTLAPVGLRRLSTAGIGWVESLAAAGIILVVGLLLSAGSLMAAGAGGLEAALHEGAASTMSRSTLRLRAFLLSGQQAVVLALLAAAGLMIGTLWNLAHQPLGFAPSNVWLADFSVPRGYAEDAARYQALIDRIRENVQAVGQRSVAVSFAAPLERRFVYASVRLQDGESLAVVSNDVTDGYFDVLRIPFITGRDFRRTDPPERVVIVNRTFAVKYLGGAASAVGQVMRVGGAPLCEVIGVVGDIREQDLAHPMDPAVYQMLAGSRLKASGLLVVTRSNHDAPGTAEVLGQAVRRADPRMYVKVTRLADRLREQTATARLHATLLGLLAAFTLVLASLGVFALVAQFAADRRRELGLRLALGAGPGSLIRTVTATVAWATAQGVVGGCVLGWWATRMLEGFLFNVKRLDGRIWLVGVLLIVGAAFTASWVPAYRASKLDPATVLRHE